MWLHRNITPIIDTTHIQHRKEQLWQKQKNYHPARGDAEQHGQDQTANNTPVPLPQNQKKKRNTWPLPF